MDTLPDELINCIYIISKSDSRVFLCVSKRLGELYNVYYKDVYQGFVK